MSIVYPPSIVAVAGLAACTGGAPGAVALEGRVDAWNRAEDEVIRSVDAVARVEAFALLGGPEPMFLCEAPVGDRARFALEVPADALVLLEALDAHGELVGSAIARAKRPHEPAMEPRVIDRESSVEAEVFLAAGADPALWPEIEAVIDEPLAVRVASASDFRTAVAGAAGIIASAGQDPVSFGVEATGTRMASSPNPLLLGI